MSQPDTHSTDEENLNLARQRERECKVEGLAYELSLACVTPLRWFTVGGGAVLSATASFLVLKRPEGWDWPLMAGVCSIVATCLGILHTALKCDSYQAECVRLSRAFSTLKDGFRKAQTSRGPDLQQQLDQRETELQETKRGVSALPFRSSRRRAEGENAS